MVSLYVLTMPLLVFVHELGHAAAALALLQGRVAVGVGRPPHVVHLAFGRLTVAFHPWIGLWRAHGLCAHRRPDSWTGEVLIAAAGPAASLLGCIVTRCVLVRVGPGLLHDALAVMTLYFLTAGVASLVPRSFHTYGSPMRSDGGLIVDALLHRNARVRPAGGGE
jgi:hypothetical protein